MVPHTRENLQRNKPFCFHFVKFHSLLLFDSPKCINLARLNAWIFVNLCWLRSQCTIAGWDYRLEWTSEGRMVSEPSYHNHPLFFQIPFLPFQMQNVSIIHTASIYKSSTSGCMSRWIVRILDVVVLIIVLCFNMSCTGKPYIGVCFTHQHSLKFEWTSYSLLTPYWACGY